MAAAAPGTQKKMLGKEVHPRVLAWMTKDGTTHVQEWVTGKLLETDNLILLELLDDSERLQDRIDHIMTYEYHSEETRHPVAPWEPSHSPWARWQGDGG